MKTQKTSLPLALLLCALLALVVKIFLAWNTYGTNDVTIWAHDLVKIRSEGVLALYRDGISVFRGNLLLAVEPFNHPPFMTYLIQAWGWLSETFGLPFGFWIRVTSSLADVGSLWIVWKIVDSSAELNTRPGGLLLMALSPVSIMVSGFHGNTDPIMICFLLLSIYFLTSGRSDWLAGAAFGMAMNIKVVPILIALAVMFYLPNMRRRLELICGAGIVFLIPCLPFLLRDPRLILTNLFGYSPLPYHWGFSRFIQLYVMIGEKSPGILTTYERFGKPVAILVVLIATVWMNWRSKKPEIFLQAGFIYFLFLFLTPGWGAQYLAWLVPWVVVMRGWQPLFYYVASGLFLLELYTYWSRSFPWYEADMLYTADLHSPMFLYFVLESLCWLGVGCVALLYWKRLSNPPPAFP